MGKRFDPFVKRDFYIQLGDADHLPMKTVHETDLRDALDTVEGAVDDGWPVRVQFGGSDVDGETFVREWGRAYDARVARGR